MGELRYAALGAACVGLSVGLGAFGAHGLRAILAPEALATWETATRYLAYHGLGLFAVAYVHGRAPGRATRAAGLLFPLGMALFSGSLYAYTLTGVSTLGMVAPVGGLSFMAGWAALAVAAWRGARSVSR